MHLKLTIRIHSYTIKIVMDKYYPKYDVIITIENIKL